MAGSSISIAASKSVMSLILIELVRTWTEGMAACSSVAAALVVVVVIVVGKKSIGGKKSGKTRRRITPTRVEKSNNKNKCENRKKKRSGDV